MNAVAGRRADAEEGAVPLRPDAAELLRRRRPRHATWTSTASGRRSTSRRWSPGSAAACSSTRNDHELGQACIRAWNDWLYEEWYLAHPTRIIPLGIAYAQPIREAAVAEIHRNAERGFTAITMPERPHLIGLPDLWQRDHWDPIIQACVDTDTVISLHVGSSGGCRVPAGCARPPDRRHAVRAALAHRLPPSGCGRSIPEAPRPQDRDERGRDRVGGDADRPTRQHHRPLGLRPGWDDRPADVLRRNFWFCTIDDPSTIDTRDMIGVENIMVETDYPHGDGTWPDTQLVDRAVLGRHPRDEPANDVQRERGQAVPAPAARRGAPGVAGTRRFHARRRLVCEASHRMTRPPTRPTQTRRPRPRPARRHGWLRGARIRSGLRRSSRTGVVRATGSAWSSASASSPSPSGTRATPATSSATSSPP